ncbi:MAG: peptide-methionine (R)-S-oxide reductase, partial [Ferrovibrio sp.]|uniref:peptide-methionine (R)-S-oxide reductase n=1 Tax=Ferrovibrio sp. TaxID=1917215 RepID=UPI00260EA4A9
MTDTTSKPLSPEAERVLRGHGTERPGTSPLNREKRQGKYVCAGCGTEVFASDTKYDSGSGWPSFYAPVADNVAATVDTSLGMRRI